MPTHHAYRPTSPGIHRAGRLSLPDTGSCLARDAAPTQLVADPCLPSVSERHGRDVATNMIMTVLEPLAVDRTRWPWRTNSRGFLKRLCASDRMSSCEQWPLDVRDALLNEFQHGIATIKSRDMASGAAFGAALNDPRPRQAVGALPFMTSGSAGD
jgi:hypothetical protein